MPRPELSTLRYPNLWQGCVGAWCPSQSGATDYRLFDDSGNNNHGVLTNMDPGTDWVPSDNKLALDFDGTNDYVNASRGFRFFELSQDACTVSFWNKNSSGTTGVYVALASTTNGNPFLIFQASGASINLGHRSDAAGDTSAVGGTWQSSSWRLLTGVSTPSSLTLLINGVQVATTSRTANATTLNQITLGALNRAGSLSNYAISQIDDIRIYNRALSPYEIRQLASSRGAAYERSRGRKKAYVPGYRITAPSRIQTGSARTIDGTDTDSLSRGLIGAWCPSLGASGYRLLDRSGNNNHGTLTNMDPGTDWVPSGGKLALDFDGINDYVDTGSNIGCNGANYRTISHWFKRSTNSTNHFLGCWAGSNAGGDRFGFYLLAQTLYVVAEGSGAGNTGYASWNANSNFFEWTHLLLQFDGSQPSFLTRLTLAVNGTFVQLQTPIGTVPTSLGTGLGNFFIGYNPAASQPYTTGQVDDVRLYRRPLTAQEVRLLYTGGRGVGLLPEAKPKRARIVAWDNQDKISVPARVLTNTDSLKRGLVGHWSPSVSGPQGNRLMDLSGQNNHGTLTNMDYQTDYVPSAEKGGRMALDFDGSNDGVSVSSFNMNTLNNSNNCVSLWLNPTTTNTISRPFAVGESGTGFALRFNFQNLEFTFGGTAVLSVPMGNASYAGKWTHILGVADNSGARLFFNGVQVGTRSDTVGITKTIGLGIGYRFGINSEYFNGQLDDVRIYNRVLTPSEIRLLAQSRMPERATPQRTRTVFYSSGLVSYLRRRTYNSILGSGVLS